MKMSTDTKPQSRLKILWMTYCGGAAATAAINIMIAHAYGSSIGPIYLAWTLFIALFWPVWPFLIVTFAIVGGLGSLFHG